MTFAAGPHALDTTPPVEKTGDSITVFGCEADDLFATSSLLPYSTEIPGDWDIHTLLHAAFNDSLLAGNINFYLNEIRVLRLKRRAKGTLKWLTLYEQEISNVGDLNLVWYDISARSGVSYEYTIVPVFDHVEGALFSNEIASDFRGLFIMDKDSIFTAHLDVKIIENRNKPCAVVTTINRKYPFVVSNGMNNYDSGSVSAQFVEYDPGNNVWDIDGARRYVRNLKDFLYSGNAKILKYEDGRMWLISVSSPQISDDEDDYHAQVHTSFDWAEIGDCENTSDLYANNIIDVDG
jgi:hypothetical protein